MTDSFAKFSDATQRIYGREIEKFLSTFRDQYGVQAEDAPLSMIADYLSGYIRLHRSRSGYYQHVAALKTWCARMNKGTLQAPGLPAAAQVPSDLRILSLAELNRLLEEPRGHVCGVMMRLIVGTGIRLGEIVRILTGDLEEDGRRLVLRAAASEGGRRIGVPDSLRYPLLREAHGKTSECSLFSVRETNGRAVPVSGRCLQIRLSQAAARTGLGRIRVQDLRDSFAVHALRAGADVQAIAFSMGYRSVSSMDRYVSLVPPAERKVPCPYNDVLSMETRPVTARD